jgi:hypothetical protein
MATTRTVEQLDLALTSVETQLPRINAGIQTTLRQNNLVLEAEIDNLKDMVGVAADASSGAPATGQVADIAALTALIQDLRTRVAALEAV